MTKKWLKLKEKSLLNVLSVAPMPYLVEQLTLNQRAQGSSPWKRTKQTAIQTDGFFVWCSFPGFAGRLHRSRCALRFSSQGLSACPTFPRKVGLNGPV